MSIEQWKGDKETHLLLCTSHLEEQQQQQPRYFVVDQCVKKFLDKFDV
jgi:hypothetical protein